VIKYLGSKRTLIAPLLAVAERLAPAGTLLDLFSGTSRVGHAFKAAGWRVLANDHNAYALELARCYVEADAERWNAPAEALLAELSALPPAAGFFTETYCRRARFVHPSNGMRIDAMRERIAQWDLEPPLRAVLLTALMEAADRVDSTTGVQMAYLKCWAPRALKPLELRLPALLPRAPAGPGQAHNFDAVEAAAQLEGDLAYLDPPYNQHKYLGNYHVWETLVRWDRPEVYGVAQKRVDCRTRASDFNSRPRAAASLAALVRAVRAEHVLLSFNDEGFVAEAEIQAALAERGPVRVLDFPRPRYVGARIGIHSPAGVPVGQVGRLVNTERLYAAGPRVAALDSLGARIP
jgi:adenine-specific DNA-methyltransferase